MNTWEQRGQVGLVIIFTLMGATYLGERVVYHAVAGAQGLVTSVVIIAILAGLGWLIYRGHGWLRWLVAAFFVLNGLGVPTGMADVFGPALSLLLSLMLLVGHLGCAIALCFTPGLRAFFSFQRAQRARPGSM